MRSGAKFRPVQTLVPGHKPIDLVAYYLHQADYYPECELHTKRWFVENVRPDWVMFDVGANIGYYSILFSRLAPAGKIYAFEPTETFSMLKENLAHNACNNVTALQIALGMVNGPVEDNIFRTWGGEPERHTYNFSTIDDLVMQLKLRRLDCVKIDVDSFDFEVLRGAEETLRHLNPWVVVELCHALSRRNQSAPQALEWLACQGYRTAHVLEHENFVLHHDHGQLDGSGCVEQRILLTFENRPVILPSPWVKDAPIENFFAPVPLAHNEAKFVADDASRRLSIDVPGPQWAYACSWRRQEDGQIARPFILELKLQITGGAVGLGCVVDDLTRHVGKEIEAVPNNEMQVVQLCIEDAAAAKHLVLRNVDPAGHAAKVIVYETRTFSAMKNPLL